MERWQAWGLSAEEWQDCLEAARELAEHAHGERTLTAEEIAAQLAVAKAAEERHPSADEPATRVPVRLRREDE